MQTKRHLRILLANPPWYDETRPWLWGVRAGSRWPHMQNWMPERALPPYLPFPHFLAQATAMLERHNELTVSLVDSVALAEQKQSFTGSAASFQPDIIFMETSTPSLENDMAIAKTLKQLLPDCLIGVGGTHGKLSEPAWLEDHEDIDFACFGEYEESLEEFILAKLNQDEKPVSGVHFKNKNSEIVPGPARPPLADLDILPRYAYHHLPMHRYNDNPFGLPSPSVQVWSSRGCPFKCTFCVWPQVIYKQRKFRKRSITKVVDEIQWLIEAYGFRSFYFDDDTTNADKKRTLALAEEIKKRKLGVPWAMMARADLMDQTTLKALHSAGMRAVKYGVESAASELVDNCDKSLKLSKVIDACRWTRELGIKMHLTFMFGLPGETEQTAEETIRLALELNPDQLQFSLCTPFPGTSFHRQAEDNGWITSTASMDGFNDAALELPTISSARLSDILKDARARWERHRLVNTSQFKKLFQNLKTLTPESRLIVYGTGKHTRKLFPHLESFINKAGISLAGFIDDNAPDNASCFGYPVSRPADSAKWNPSHVLLSSDTFEAAMADTALKTLPDTELIRIYT